MKIQLLLKWFNYIKCVFIKHTGKLQKSLGVLKSLQDVTSYT